MRAEDNINVIKGVGVKVADAFSKLNIVSVKDLMLHIPKNYELYEEPSALSEEKTGYKVALRGRVLNDTWFMRKKGGMTLNKVSFLTGDCKIGLVFFNMPYIKKAVEKEDEIIVRGILSHDRFGLHINQPAVFSLEKYKEVENTLVPVYSTVKGISNNAVRKYMAEAFASVSLKDDYLNTDELNELGLISFPEALRALHFPRDYEDFVKGHDRLVFHEFISFLLPVKRDREASKYSFDKPMIEVAETVRYIESLPFELTDAQKNTWNDIKNDMTSGLCMNRLVQGDVGSGKTVIAFLALLMNCVNGYQGALMAPTEVLAKQHYENVKAMAELFPDAVRPVLLIGSMSAKDKNEARKRISSGDANLIIGTNALIQASVEYKTLTLVITDEQHRFGVKQRESLADKGGNVHILVMSATPIPRTLAMIMYGDLAISVIDVLPAGRLPIKNAAVDFKYRKKAFEFILDEVKKGHQAYIICPMVEDNDNDELQNVIDYTDMLNEIMPKGTGIAFLHGKMKGSEKNAIMDRFAGGDIDILVSTTVIEVGINVPNATVMLVENADRFGLATLHQLRGRVGRGDAQSYCIFMSGKTDQKVKERLEILTKYNDGFKIADEDMKLRGPGDIFGIRQSGEFNFRFADIYNDSTVLKKCAAFTDKLLLAEYNERMREVSAGISDYDIGNVDFRTI